MANDPDSGQFNVNSGSENTKEVEDDGNPNAPNLLFYAAQQHLDGMDKEELKKSMEEDTETESTIYGTNMADMTKLRTQLELKEYKEERNGWADKIATVECQHLVHDLAACVQGSFYPLCTMRAITLFACKIKARKEFCEDYDKMKIKEYIRIMEETQRDGTTVEATESSITHQLFTK